MTTDHYYARIFQALTDPDVPCSATPWWPGCCRAWRWASSARYVITRRISYIAGAISHSVLGGIGAALFLQVVWRLRWCDPMFGAVAGGPGVGSAHRPGQPLARQREDTVIGAIWAVGMAVGLLFFAKTPGYADPMSYLFGNILLISRGDLWRVAALDALVVGVG